MCEGNLVLMQQASRRARLLENVMIIHVDDPESDLIRPDDGGEPEDGELTQLAVVQSKVVQMNNRTEILRLFGFEEDPTGKWITGTALHGVKKVKLGLRHKRARIRSFWFEYPPFQGLKLVADVRLAVKPPGGRLRIVDRITWFYDKPITCYLSNSRGDMFTMISWQIA